MAPQQLVVIGTDGSANGRGALAWALAHARQIGAAVEVVTASAQDPTARLYGAVAGAELAWDQVKRQQAEDVAACLEGMPNPPPLSRTVVEGDPVQVLISAARHGDLLVLGSHGRGHRPLRRALLGSVAEGCLRATAIPVVVVPAPAEDVADAACTGLAATAP